MALTAAEELTQKEVSRREEAISLLQGLSRSQTLEVLHERNLANRCALPWCSAAPRSQSSRGRFLRDSLSQDFLDSDELSGPAARVCSPPCGSALRDLFSRTTITSPAVSHPDRPARAAGDAASASSHAGSVIERHVDPSSQQPPSVEPQSGAEEAEKEGGGEDAISNPQEHANFVFSFAGEGGSQKGAQRSNSGHTAMEQYAIGELSLNLPDDNDDNGHETDEVDPVDEEVVDTRASTEDETSERQQQQQQQWRDPLLSVFQRALTIEGEDMEDDEDDDLEQAEARLSSPYARICSLLSDLHTETTCQYLRGLLQSLPKARHSPSSEWQSSIEQAFSLALPFVMRKLNVHSVILQPTLMRELTAIAAASSPLRAVPGLGTRYHLLISLAPSSL